MTNWRRWLKDNRTYFVVQTAVSPTYHTNQLAHQSAPLYTSTLSEQGGTDTYYRVET